MFWSLFIFRKQSTREPALVVFDDDQGDLLYSAGPHRNLHQPQLTHEKLGRVFGKYEGEWTGKVEISSRKKSLAAGEASTAMF